MIHFTVNGKPRQSPVALTLASYLRDLRVNPLSVAVEVDGIIITRDAFETTLIEDGARLEIVRMMGGG